MERDSEVAFPSGAIFSRDSRGPAVCEVPRDRRSRHGRAQDKKDRREERESVEVRAPPARSHTDGCGSGRDIPHPRAKAKLVTHGRRC